MTDVWDGIDRRQPPHKASGEADAAFMNYIVAQLETLNAKMNAIHIDNINHKAETSLIKRDVEEIKDAFPKDDEGSVDFDGHHDYHWKLVVAAKSWKEIWVDVRKKVFGGVAWAIVIFVAYSIWEEIKRRAQQ